MGPHNSKSFMPNFASSKLDFLYDLNVLTDASNFHWIYWIIYYYSLAQKTLKNIHKYI